MTQNTLSFQIQAIHNLDPLNLGCDVMSEDLAVPRNSAITRQEIDAEVSRLQVSTALSVCENEAKKRLTKTDWSVLPDVNITNKAEFETYRAAVRQYALDPVASPVWPDEPKPIWGS
jgi:hypothetical protein